MNGRGLPVTVTERLKQLPTSPGCYLYRDESDAVLYVGKAINLRNRVRSYFQASAKHGPRIQRLVKRTRDIEWIVVETELEALVLECNLIKKHRPPFNVRLRDDKSYPFIVVTKEAFPRVLFTRNPKRGQGKTFGPYSSAYAVRDTLKLLHKVFPLIPCGKSWSGREEQRPCLYFHLGQCLAPCAGIADREQYLCVIGQVERFLKGDGESLVAEMEQEMTLAADAEQFEKAAELRDRAAAVRHVLERQKVLSSDEVDRDVVAVVKDERMAAVQVLYVRNGKLVGQQQFVLDGTADRPPGELVQEFVKQYYADAPEVPREILLPAEFEERKIVQQWLRQKRGSAVTLEVPQGGEGLGLVDMAAENAAESLKVYATELASREAWGEEAAAVLAQELGLPSPPRRIEAFDISNVQGTAPTASMVVAQDGAAAKSEYRRFKIKWHPESPDDFAMMGEAVTRRLRAYLDGDPKFSVLPDLIVIDGGKGQLGAALAASASLGLELPMAGLAKKQEILYVRVGDGYKEIILPIGSPALVLLTRLRDEAHRFALTYHRKLRDKRMHGSVLDEIPGIGPRRRRMLLRSFGSIAAIRHATVEQIAAVPTLTRRQAEVIHEFLAIE
ncbi:MAG: excinuclease ABC subunit UvrC [Fimbriimonadaceae bacterium]|nr:excinuclease ABC subunit UvrC [Fimbriimonadaceae bacterium]